MEKPNLAEARYCQGCAVSTMCGQCPVINFEATKEGQLLKNMGPRYGMWKWQDEEAMKHYLPDTDPLWHGLYQAENVAIPLIEFQNMGSGRHFNAEEAKLLYLANVLHDFHEGLWGDIPVPQKDRANDEAELELNLQVVSGLLREDPRSEFMTNYRGVIGDFEQWSFLGRAFTTGERCGYFLTGVEAWTLRQHQDLDADTRALCADMGRTVISYNLPKLAAAEEFDFAGHLLARYQPVIDQIR